MRRITPAISVRPRRKAPVPASFCPVRTLRYALVLLIALALLAAAGVRARYGGGADFPDRSGPPLLGAGK